MALLDSEGLDPTGASGEPVGVALKEGFVDPPLRMFAAVGDFMSQSLRTLGETPRALLYFSEVLRQAGILVAGTTLLTWGMMFTAGTFCGLMGDATFRSYGADAYVGVYTAWCGIREAGPIMFGYIFAAKVGCGLVAEIGSMKISEELDALDALGVGHIRFVLATRVLAAFLVVPPLFVTAITVEQFANFFIVLVQIGHSSPGGFEHIHFLFQDPQDLFYAGVKAFLEATAIVFVGTYFGSRARGGPVGVGRATAQAMMVNLIAVHVIAGLCTRLFWSGYSPNAPIGG
jgi:phospholipid/cholesterol/gamma-HCH transport system permease protein